MTFEIRMNRTVVISRLKECGQMAFISIRDLLLVLISISKYSIYVIESRHLNPLYI